MEDVGYFEDYAYHTPPDSGVDADACSGLSTRTAGSDFFGHEDEEPADISSCGVDSYDPVKMYLNEIGFTRLLKRNEELAVARSIQEGRERAVKAVFSFPHAVEKLLSAAGMVRRGEMDLSQLVRPAEDREGFFFAMRQIERLHRKLSAPQSAASAPPQKTPPAASKKAARGVSETQNREKLLEKIVSLGLKCDFTAERYREISDSLQKTGRNTKAKRPGRNNGSASGLPYAQAESLLRRYREAQEQIEAGRKILIEANLRLVVSSARRYSGIGTLGIADLIQEGNIGLMRATELFDVRMGYKFSTYAMCWIKQAITRALSNQSRMIRLPVHTTYEVSKIIRASRELVQEHGDEPTPEKIAERLKMPAKKVTNLLGMSNEPLSLNMSAGDESTSLSDYIEDKTVPSALEMVIKDDLKVKINEALGILQPKEKRIVAVRFGIGEEEQTLETLAQEYGVTRERIRQIETGAIKKLRVTLAELGV